jgi:hypothetical protein
VESDRLFLFLFLFRFLSLFLLNHVDDGADIHAAERLLDLLSHILSGTPYTRLGAPVPTPAGGCVH